MGYTTSFEGKFSLNKVLEQNHFEYLNKFSDTRRMKRDASKTELFPDDCRKAVNLPVGEEGGYFVSAEGTCGQSEDSSVLNYNGPPAGQPGLWCQWVPTKNGDGIEWDGSEKFYDYVEWVEYLIKHFLAPWGYVLNGKVKWRGEEFSDIGTITVKNNVVQVKHKW